MLENEVKLPSGQQLVRLDETFTGEHVAMVKISETLFAVCWVSPAGHTEDYAYGTLAQTAGSFEARLTVH